MTKSSSIRSGLTSDEIREAFLENLRSGMGRLEQISSSHDIYYALALTVRDRVFGRFCDNLQRYGRENRRRVAYLSAEYLPGPHLANNLLDLGMTEATREALGSLGYNLDEILAQEEEPGLGNGGLGRLASCYMDSMASVQVPAVGYGIRYEFGIFDQVIRDGWQQEITDKWLRNGNPWEIARPEIAYEVSFGGRTESVADEQGRFRVRWIPETEVKGVAYDTPIPGYRVDTATSCASGKRKRSNRSTSPPSTTAITTGRCRTRCIGEHHEGAVSERRSLCWQGTAAQAAVLLRELLAPGHAPRFTASSAARPARFTRNGRSNSTTRTRPWPWRS